jgi:signal transduction histidine kinase
MSSMVDEILLFASTEDRQNRYVLERLQISQIVKSVTVSTESLIHQSGVTFEQHVQPDLPEVLGDLVRITQCLDNLIGNAVKYGGEQKWISLNINVALREHGLEKEVRISVVDRGIGIERSELIHIFDPFYRSPRVNAAQIHGTGLGLSLAKKIAEAMGGRISVHSEPSLGSTFTLHLPVALLDEGQSAASVSS